MQSKLFKMIAVTIMIAFLSGFASASVAVGNPTTLAPPMNGKVTVTTSQASISVTGGNNVPFYHIQLTNSNKSYEIKFQNLQEFVDSNNDGQFQNSELVPLSSTSFPGLGWNFSGFNTVNDTNGNIQNVNFNFTHTATTSISLNNHIDVANGNQVKFDILLNNYLWQSSNTSAKLAIKIQVAGGNLTAGANANDLSFGSGFFNTVSTASSPNGNVGVTTQIVNTNTFYIIFDHFSSNITLDPLFGVLSTSGSTSGPTSNTSPSSTHSTPGFEVIALLGGLAVIGLITAKKRYN